MTSLKKNILTCFMGFAVLSIFNVNHAFAHDKPSISKNCPQSSKY